MTFDGTDLRAIVVICVMNMYCYSVFNPARLSLAWQGSDLTVRLHQRAQD
jgi:hypothetical protein